MTSNAADLRAKIAEQQQTVNQARSASQAARSDHARSNSDASSTKSGGKGKNPDDGAGNAGYSTVEGGKGTGGTPSRASPTGTERTRAPAPIEEEESSDEEQKDQTEGGANSVPAVDPRQGLRSPTPSQVPSARSNAGGRSQTGGVRNSPDASIPSNLNANQNALIAELIDINGQDSYDALSAGIGKLKKSEYLLLPTGFQIPNVSAADVGKPIAHRQLRTQDWANIYALNKGRAPDGADAKIYALLRLEAVKCGWLEDQREVAFADPPRDALQTLATDMVELRDRAATIKMASFLIPLIAEHVFRTFGHHFISTDAANYTERYTSTLRSCLAPEVVGLLPPAVMYHNSLHWVSPRRARAVLMAQLATASLPDALKIRANAAPAGTAILTTTSAILRSMETVGLDVLFVRHGGIEIDLIHRVTDLVKQDPPKYHKSYFAYGVPPPTAGELAELDRAKEAGVKFAPYAQAYINTYLREAALGRAQALKKHADQNPIQMRRASNLFRALGRGEVKTVADLFANDVGRAQNEDDW